jgi:hypothetical protein
VGISDDERLTVCGAEWDHVTARQGALAFMAADNGVVLGA